MAETETVADISYDIKIGDKVKLFGNIPGIVKYIGQIIGKPEYETYYGIVFKKPIGDTNGRIKKKIYFKCKQKHGKFVKRTDIVYPFPIIFSVLCDTMFHILSSTIFLYFDPNTIGNFCKINKGLTKIIFNIEKNYNLTWKKQWRLFISPKSEDNSFKKRWQRLYTFYKSSIFPGRYQHQEIGFGVWKITNLKNDDVISNSSKAMAIQRTLLPIVSTRYYSDEENKYIRTEPDDGSLKFDAMIQKFKMKDAYNKCIKTEKDATIKNGTVGTPVCGSIYYQHINEWNDIFKTKVKGSKPFYRKYIDRKPIKELKGLLTDFLMPSFMELSIKQWFVVNLVKTLHHGGLSHSYIIGWISTKKLIVVGGCYGTYKDEVMQSKPSDNAYTYSDDDYWSS